MKQTVVLSKILVQLETNFLKPFIYETTVWIKKKRPSQELKL